MVTENDGKCLFRQWILLFATMQLPLKPNDYCIRFKEPLSGSRSQGYYYIIMNSAIKIRPSWKGVVNPSFKTCPTPLLLLELRSAVLDHQKRFPDFTSAKVPWKRHRSKRSTVEKFHRWTWTSYFIEQNTKGLGACCMTWLYSEMMPRPLSLSYPYLTIGIGLCLLHFRWIWNSGRLEWRHL